MALKELEVKYAAKRQRPYKLSDGEGLHLLVQPSGSKLWRLKYRFEGKEKLLSFGKYPVVTLALAREKRNEAKALLDQGKDPAQVKKQRKKQRTALKLFEPIARACTEERAQRRRVVHADLLALERADVLLGFGAKAAPLTLAVNLEPCLMCLGAAITLGVDRVVYALESPNDGAIDLLGAWHPPVEQPFYRRPSHVEGSVLRQESQRLFARYAGGDGPAGMRAWARGLADL